MRNGWDFSEYLVREGLCGIMWYLVVICQMAVDDDRWGGGDAVLVLEATDEAFAEYVKDHGVNNSWTIHR